MISPAPLSAQATRPTALRERAVTGLVAGVDEAGRGAWAGPVVAAAVIYTPALDALGVRDSKLLSAMRRRQLAERIAALAPVGIGVASVDEIDQLGIMRANDEAMRRALTALVQAPHHCLIDGSWLPADLPCPAQAVVRGDASCISIAAASIIAKVSRDAAMQALHLDHPGYGWDSNKGYGTTRHHQALNRDGPCRHHRRSFAPVRVALGLV